MLQLIGPQHLAAALQAAGLDDDAARLLAWADPARRDRDAAQAALDELAVAQESLRGALAGLVAAARDVRAGAAVAWRGPAAGEYADAVAEAVGAAEGLEREAGEWLALRATAEREAEDARQDAEARLRAAEETARAALRALAVAG